MTERKTNATPSREWLLKMAEAEDRCESFSVGGMAHDFGMLEGAAFPEPPRVLGRLIEFARRAQRLSLERLAQEADVTLEDLVAIEIGGGASVPTPRTLYQVAQVLKLPPVKLMELGGLAETRDTTLNMAAVRFAARSETTATLTEDERTAFEEFVKVLVDASDGPKS